MFALASWIRGEEVRVSGGGDAVACYRWYEEEVLSEGWEKGLSERVYMVVD